MITFAITLWLLLWVTAPANSTSELKQAYPEIPLISDIRDAFLENLGETSDPAALVAGLAIGERSLLSEQTQSQMRDLSLTHLVAVSGANLAIVVGAVWFLLAAVGLNRHLRFLLGLLSMGGYVLLVGPESSVIRAATMALFVTLAMWLGRGSSPLHALALAVAVLLLLDPGLATDFGFSLSALATAGLLVAAGPIFEILTPKLPEWLALGIAAALSAQIYTTPILLMLQPGIPLYAVLANIAVEPVIAPVTILGIAAAVTAQAVPPLSRFLIDLAELGTSWIVLVSDLLTDLPFVRVHFIGPPTGIGIATGIVVAITALFISREERVRRMSTLGLLALILLGTVATITDLLRSNQAHRGWELLNCDVGQGDALLVKSSGAIALVDVGADSELIRGCLDKAGVRKIDLLILTHYDADHVAGIEGLDGIKAGLSILPGFSDDRPLADRARLYLQSQGGEALVGQRGMQGRLGQCGWEVLEPSFSAAEATDSNDASLVVKFDCEQFDVIALGDLGEPGQLRLLDSSGMKLKTDKPTVLKVAHHGSADQSRLLHEWIRPEVSVISVGSNRFGHPTDRLLRILHSVGSSVFRTDLDGPISIAFRQGELRVYAAGKLAQ